MKLPELRPEQRALPRSWIVKPRKDKKCTYRDCSDKALLGKNRCQAHARRVHKR